MDAVFVRNVTKQEMARAGSAVIFIQVAQAAVAVESVFVCKHIHILYENSSRWWKLFQSSGQTLGAEFFAAFEAARL